MVLEELDTNLLQKPNVVNESLIFKSIPIDVRPIQEVVESSKKLGNGRSVAIEEMETQVRDINQFSRPMRLVINERKSTLKRTPPLDVSNLKIGEESIGRIKNIDHEHGLSSQTVMSICQDKIGNIWMGSGNGISVYDGQLLRKFAIKEGLCDLNVWSLLCTTKGEIWMGTERGVMRYDGKNLFTYDATNGFFTSEIYGIAEDKSGAIWIAVSEVGLCRYYEGEFVCYTEVHGLGSTDILGVSSDNAGNVWACSTEGILMKLDGEKIVNYHLNIGVDGESFSIANDRLGNVWLGLFGGGLAKFDGEKVTFYDKDDGLPDNQIIRVLVSDKNEVWAGTYEGGAFQIKGNEIINYSIDNGLAFNRVLSLLEDQVHNMWVGTSGGGVSIIQQSDFKNYSQKDGLSSYRVNSIVEDTSGLIWLGNLNGFSCLSANKIENRIVNHNGDANRMTSVDIDADGNIWATSDGGIFKIAGNKCQQVSNTALYQQSGNVIKIDKENDIWIGHVNGLVRIRKEEVFFWDGLIKGSSISVISLFEDKDGSIWP